MLPSVIGGPGGRLVERIILVEQKRDQGFPWRALLRKELVKSKFIESAVSFGLP